MDSQTHIEHTLGLAALVQALVKELCRALRGRQAAVAATRSRCSTRTSGSPPGTASTASSSTCPHSDARPDPGARAPAARPDARALPGPRLARRARGGRGPARARQRRRAAGRRLRGQPRPARGDGRDRRRDGRLNRVRARLRNGPWQRALQSVREHRRPGSLRDLQELRVRGEPVHHRMPVLRQPAAQAGAEARPRRPGRREAPAPPAAAPVAAAPAPRRDPRDPGRVAAVRDDRAGRRSASSAACCGAPRLIDLDRLAVVGKPGLALVAAAHRAVHLQQHRLRVRRRSARSPCTAGCSSAGTARSRCSRCSCVGGVGGIAATAAVVPVPGRDRRQRRRAGDARRLGDPGSARAARRRGDRGRPARHGGDRGRRRADAARRRRARAGSPTASASLAGLAIGLPLARAAGSR